ncbi:ABC-type transport system involved in cytochrome c biogenesis permease subunit [Roseimicrobium gellanilyticum]|uniref:ABC-type transport system involved in cytochrome c biogenesis permease subunit n=2 Tax=Roseimicrobium gellanilyticum TaxID=748857 RepID=A0A366HFQ3_9BACT|nr:ABC-type transport system involved in cytochrome c biogenesis permease subunit [Roseimicrobium gellanilyticum]
MKTLAACCAAWALLPVVLTAQAEAPKPAADPHASVTAVPAATAPAQVASENKAAPIPLETLMDPELLKIMATIPVQQQGRVKPLETVARTTLLLPMYGKQSMKAEKFNETTGKVEPVLDPQTGKPVVNAKGKSTLSAMEWMLISLFRPDIGKELNVFVVDNSDAVVILNLHGKGKRDRYSYNEIAEGRQKLSQKMEEFRGMDPAKLSPESRALYKLSQDFLDYDMMLGHFDFARNPFGDQVGKVPAEILSPADGPNPPIAALLPKMAAYFKAHPEAQAPMANPWFFNFIRTLLCAKMNGVPQEQMNLFPPDDKNLEVWKSPGAIMQEALSGAEVSAHEYAMLTAWGELGRLDGTASSSDFKAKAKQVADTLSKAASDRGQTGHIGLELLLHKGDFFTRALYMFVLGSLALSAAWVSPGGRWEKTCKSICWGAMIIGAVLGTVGIIIRSLIMERPPITTLYETIIFITTTSVIGALLVEWMSRRKDLAMTVACISGVAGMFLSIRFFEMEGKDSLVQLQAVLITNFWLATHVPCINLGYACGMVACKTSMVYFTRRVFGVTKAGDEDARTLTRISYAFVLAGLFLSLVGTVLGGVWANYSWGRFWGWDPKENGALMIVLMNLIILHARLGGYVREAGFHVVNVILGMITIFSWFATNQLGIGLHAYGELSGAWKWLYTIWGVMAGYVVLGMIFAQMDKSSRSGGSVSGGSTREGQKGEHDLLPQAVAK